MVVVMMMMMIGRGGRAVSEKFNEFVFEHKK